LLSRLPLPVDPEKDLERFSCFSTRALWPDMLKIYPTLVEGHSSTSNGRGRVLPDTAQATEVVAAMKAAARYVRIQRIQRDIGALIEK
jgi:histone acetyltransferase (RNA polymerase elongator complex component)